MLRNLLLLLPLLALTACQSAKKDATPEEIAASDEFHTAMQQSIEVMKVIGPVFRENPMMLLGLMGAMQEGEDIEPLIDEQLKDHPEYDRMLAATNTLQETNEELVGKFGTRMNDQAFVEQVTQLYMTGRGADFEKELFEVMEEVMPINDDALLKQLESIQEIVPDTEQ